jgi:hypothetical protein
VLPGFNADPGAVDFGSVTIGKSGAPQTVTVTNDGSGILTFAAGGVSISGDVFGITADTCSGATIAAGGTCTVQVRFSPTAAGVATGQLGFTSDAPGSPHTVSLSGTGTAPVFSAAPNPVSFGDQQVGTSSAPQTVTVTNSGTADLLVTAADLSGDGFAVAADTCTDSSVAPGGTCSVSLRFSPGVVGAASGQLAFTSNAAGSPHSVGLSGTGSAEPPAVKQKQTLKPKLPKRIKLSGLTVLTPANARTNAGQRVRTIVRGGPVKPTAAGEVRYFTVVRGPNGKTSVRTFGYPNLRLKVVQKAPAVEGYTAFQRQATYLNGKRR